MTTIAEIKLWGRTIGAVSIEPGADVAAFQYTPAFAKSGFEIAPLTMPLSQRIYTFPTLSRETFHGLPGLLADCLPDKFGNALINAWLATQGRTAESFNAVERLCYTGTRGMGALEFSPAAGPIFRQATAIDIDALVKLASDVLHERINLKANLAPAAREAALRDILRVGTSAGGARAKAVIAWNRATNEVRAGQMPAGEGFEYWLIKFDGVTNNKDKELADPQGYGAIEYAYALMAQAAGIEMSECRILEENGRRHFMTRRFDRRASGEKIHMQTLGAMAHFDFNQAGTTSYEQAFLTMRQLGLGTRAREQQTRRMVFNVIARNQDDHVKNIAFLQDKTGQWALSPAYDITYANNPTGAWTNRHQMSINGKREEITRDDLRAAAKAAQLKRGVAESVIAEVAKATGKWRSYAKKAGVTKMWVADIEENFRRLT